MCLDVIVLTKHGYSGMFSQKNVNLEPCIIWLICTGSLKWWVLCSRFSRLAVLPDLANTEYYF